MALMLGAAVTDRISYGTAMPAFTSCSVAVWFYPTTLSTFRHLFIRGSFPVIRLNNPSSDEIRVRWTGATDLQYITNNADLTVNKWWYLGVSINPSGSAGEQVNVLLGDLNTPATERTYGTAEDGVTPNSNSGAELAFGNHPVDLDAAFQGRLAFGWLWPDVILTHRQFREQQRQKAPVRSGARIVTEFGEFGTGVQHDRSGYGNYGTVTGATYARAPELDTIFMPKRRLWTPAAVVAAGNAVPQVWAQYRARRVA